MVTTSSTAAPGTVGVCGAGTMGAGIAQLCCQAGAETLLMDPDADARSGGAQRIEAGLERAAQRGRLSAEAARDARGRLHLIDSLDGLRDCELVIEAAPESLAIKHELFSAVAQVVSSECVLATNTSSLLVTAVAAAVPGPERVVGMHYFNPPTAMRLLEVVAGLESSPDALAVARAAGEAQGRHVIQAADGIGFIVNRCNRPFGLEALTLLAERIAPLETIDRICRMGGGFRMGPFELADLVGVDTGLDVARSFWEQGFGEPRWRPSPITVRTVAAGRRGRKSGRGYYDYTDGAHRPEDPERSPAPVPADGGPVVIAGDTTLASELADAASDAGWEVLSPAEAGDRASPFLILDLTGDEEPEAPLQGGPQAICCAAGSLAAQDPGGSAVGFHALPPLAQSRLVELTRGPDSSDAAARRAELFFTTLGLHHEWVGDGPGLVLGRIVCQIVNEAAFALGEGVGSAQDIDAGMVYGLNHPRGILAWADEIGIDHVLGVLHALADETGDPRYRLAPILRSLGLSGRLGISTAEGFHRYEDQSPDMTT